MTEYPNLLEGRIALLDHFLDFSKAVGLPGVILLAGLYVVWNLGDRYVDYVIEAEKLERQHRIQTELAQLEISKGQQSMLSSTLHQFLKAHMDQAEAVADISRSIKTSYGNQR